MPKYTITSGTFRDHDDTIKGPGDTIELPEELASQHATRLQAVVLETAAEADAPAAQQAPVEAQPGSSGDAHSTTAAEASAA